MIMSNIISYIAIALAVICLLLFLDRQYLSFELNKSKLQVAALSSDIKNQNDALQKLSMAEKIHQQNLQAAIAKANSIEKINSNAANKILSVKVSTNCNAAILWGIKIGNQLSQWPSK